MCDQTSSADNVRTQINSLESRLLKLKRQLTDIEEGTAKVPNNTVPRTSGTQGSLESNTGTERPWPLNTSEYTRYGRQMIMPETGLQGNSSRCSTTNFVLMYPLLGQLSLRKSSVLIIGAGGLGCPAAQYLAGAGIGTIGLVDGDVVELSNLHRQILHTTERVGQLKVDSAIAGLSQYAFAS